MDTFDSATKLEEQMVQLATAKRIPIGGSIELLPLCNMNCDMCYVRLSKSEMERQGRLRTVEEWTALADEMKNAGVLFLLLTGGEPLLYPDFKALYLYLQKIGMILTLNTNGTLINKEWADFFKENPPRRINITLYGTDEQTYKDLCHYSGGFEKTVNAIRLLRERGIDVKVNGSLVKANRHDADKITAIARSLDAAVNIDTYMYPATRERNKPFDDQARLNPQEAAQAKVHLLKEKMTPEEFNNYAMQTLYLATHTPPGEPIPGHIKCRAGRSSFTINWQGKMRPCVMLTNPSTDVFEKGFEKAWKYILEETGKIMLSPKCNQCTLRNVCQTCAACALLESGEYEGVPEYMCQYTMETLKELSQHTIAQ